MPALKISDSSPSSISQINRWSDDKEAQLNNHASQIAALAKRISDLEKK